MISEAVQFFVRGPSIAQAGVDIGQLQLVAALGVGAVFMTALALRFGWELWRPRASREAMLRFATLEVTLWVLLLGGLLARLLVLGIDVYVDQSVAPANSYDIKVLCGHGGCEYLYPNRTSKDQLVVPLGQPVRLIASSLDHNYTLRMPGVNMLQNAAPGHYSSIWFTLYSSDPSSIRCEQGCGRLQQPQRLLGLRPRQFEEWSSSDRVL